MKSFPFVCCAIHSPTYLVVCLPGDNKKYVLLCALKGGGGYFCLMRFFSLLYHLSFLIMIMYHFY